ncbi:MAG: helicase-related protein, partial [Myxococcales bacterium]
MFEPDRSNQGITAVLGPTNTGKTHRAIERMLEHQTGMIGLPLRLLAREVYDRVTARIGERHVALITGEEKRIPAHPRYFICTVEAMPMDREVDFLAVDEVQLGTHRERGHVFTDRLLHARGVSETWFLGSDTVRYLVERLVPTARISRHPRLSQLRGRLPASLGSLPKRTAVVAFSASRVYELAERIRVKHGGAALVLGALSPRTRNAQVALYQSGEVDYLVATDAIGMGLNLDVSHVAFADVNKFDGRESRALELAELAQIAGRAGRYLDDGTFGVLAPRQTFPKAVVRALERHEFPAETQLFWRNSTLDYDGIESLIESLRQSPGRRELRPIEPAEDHQALLALSAKPEVRARANTPELVTLLWEVCQIPDYPQLLFELHVSLLSEIYLQLTGPAHRLDSNWINQQLRRIDRVDGDIEALMGRIADIRTWNYVSQHTAWIEPGFSLAERSRDIEDRLSDALHERLVTRFVERRQRQVGARPALANRGLRAGRGNPFAHLLSQATGTPPDPVGEQARFTDRLVDAQHEEIRIDVQGRLWFSDQLVGKLLPGGDLLHPDVQVRLEPDPGQGAASRVRRRLLAFSRDLVEALLAPLHHPA